MELVGDPVAGRMQIIDFLEWPGAPDGSLATLPPDDVVRFGRTRGLGVYLNGTDLPKHVYAESDVNEVVRMLRERLGRKGLLQSFWEGPRETAFYFYGGSAQTIRDLIAPVLAEHPLAQRCRVVDLPQRLGGTNASGPPTA